MQQAVHRMQSGEDIPALLIPHFYKISRIPILQGVQPEAVFCAYQCYYFPAERDDTGIQIP